ncbi:MAG: hypothetical protein JWN68_1564 [Nocardioides sp.]|jgi:hypothetical protein|uniref:hypothetical protein n=1 Tax=Nocardioides sp. TaxID=35761 RepID=UPI00263374F1|nr:hypothetical protein [Nocardioides sp.]MCW2833611.1 hypothetical protein [Nocardioides sp.]
MVTMILISTAAMLTGIVGSFVIWRFDAHRADEIEQTPMSVVPATLAVTASNAPATPIIPR